MPASKPAKYDERQLAARGRIGLTCFTLTLVVVMLNGVFNDLLGEWADVYTQSSVIFWTMFAVFTLWAMLKDAFFATGRQRLAFVLMVTAVTALMAVMLIVNLLGSGHVAASSLVTGGAMLVVVIVAWIAVLRDRAAERAADNE